MASQLANVDAERAVLGAVFVDAEKHQGHSPRLAELANVLHSGDFYREANAIIYRAMLDFQHSNNPLDIVSMTEYFRKRGNLDKIGGIPFLTQLATSVPTTAGMMEHAAIVRDYARRRTLADKAAEIQQAAQDESSDIAETISKAQEDLAGAMNADTRADMHPMKETMLDYMELLNKRAKGENLGISTGFSDYDKLINRLQPGTLHTIAARPGMGKTAFALSITANVCKQGYHVLYHSMEMPRLQVIDRLVASLATVPLQTLKNIKTRQNGMGSAWNRLTVAADKLARYPLEIDDRGHLSYSAIASKAIMMQAATGLDLIIVDHVQIMGTDKGKRYSSRANELDDTTGRLKALAIRLNVPIIVLSQLNRATEKADRKDKRPTMADLRDSGGIEQNSDTVAAIYRPGYYMHKNEDERASLEVLKSRDGELGTVYLKWFGAYTKFSPGAKWENPLSKQEQKAADDITKAEPQSDKAGK